jgi:mRNA interferase MazF
VAGGVARGDVRLYRFAAPDKSRPVVVLTRDSALGYLATATVAPVTSTMRGVPSEVVLDTGDGMKGRCAVNLHNAITVSQQRLGRRVAQLGTHRMAEICAALRFSLGCDLP